MELVWHHIKLKANSEQDLAKLFSEHLRKADYNSLQKETALYLLTNISGSFSSIALWQNALEHSPRFANPILFPYTLSNATAGVISRAFDIQGPNYTLIDTDLNIEKMKSFATQDLQNMNLKNALFVIWNIYNIKPIEVKVSYSIYKNLDDKLHCKHG